MAFVSLRRVVVWVEEDIVTVARSGVSEDKPSGTKPSVRVVTKLLHQPAVLEHSVVTGTTGLANADLEEAIERVREGNGED